MIERPSFLNPRALLAAILSLLALLSVLPAAPAFAQVSASPHTSGFRWDVMRRLVGAIAPDPDGPEPLTFPAVRHNYDADGQLFRTEKGVLASWQAQTILPAN